MKEVTKEHIQIICHLYRGWLSLFVDGIHFKPKNNLLI